MLRLRPSAKRGSADYGWLKTFYSFSFANYYDPSQMGFRGLRVINEDRIAGGQGFGEHGHSDMEIVTYVLEGTLEHRDSLGTGEMIHPGEVQRMSAGTGIQHSEFNASKNEAIHLLQIWIEPNEYRLSPSYEQKTFSIQEKKGRLRIIASPDAREGSLKIHSDAMIFASILGDGESVEYVPAADRGIWIQIIRGSLSVNGSVFSAGDGVAAEEEAVLKLIGTGEEAEFLLFDLA